MSRNIKYIIIAFLVFSIVLAVISITCFKSSDVTVVYTRNNLSWSNTDVFEDGSIDLDLTNGKTTIRLKNDVKGNIGYNIYLYSVEEDSNNATLSSEDMTEINKNEYPDSLKNCDIKCAYRGYVKGGKKKDFEIRSTADTGLKLLMVIEDNNSYPKEEKSIPTIANVKFSAEVLLDEQYPRGKDYSFSLKDEAGTVIETVHNDDGYISFSNIALKQKGTYIYYLSQNEGKDDETTYDKSIYKINVVVEEKYVAKVSYEKGGTPKETLPRFSNYKEIIDAENIVEYPTNEKKANEQPNYLLISTLVICILLILFYILMGKKKG